MLTGILLLVSEPVRLSICSFERMVRVEPFSVFNTLCEDGRVILTLSAIGAGVGVSVATVFWLAKRAPLVPQCYDSRGRLLCSRCPQGGACERSGRAHADSAASEEVSELSV